jgi:hypothetical protein
VPSNAWFVFRYSEVAVLLADRASALVVVASENDSIADRRCFGNRCLYRFRISSV